MTDGQTSDGHRDGFCIADLRCTLYLVTKNLGKSHWNLKLTVLCWRFFELCLLSPPDVIKSDTNFFARNSYEKIVFANAWRLPVLIIHSESKKLDPSSFQHNFRKCCPILILLSLLRTEIILRPSARWNLPPHPKSASALYLVKWTRMYWPTLHDFVIKDVTVKQVTLNETKWSKSTWSVHKLYSKCPPFRGHTLKVFLRSSPLIASSKIDCSRLHQTSMSSRFNYGFVSGRHDAAWQSSFAPTLFQETLSLFFFGIVPFWIMRDFDQILIVVAKPHNFT